VAQQFEAIFLRQLLGSMEKSGGLGGFLDALERACSNR
jgi:Rod binding domain-containing protein